MSATSNHLLAWGRQHGVTYLCLLAVVGMSLTLTRQSIEHLRLLHDAPSVAVDAIRAEQRQPPTTEQLQSLFGALGQKANDQPPPATMQQMTLLASFVSPDIQRSAAIIQVTGTQPKRIAVGGEINASTRLKAVYPDHVILQRGALEESLNFPDVRSPSIQRHIQEQASDPLEQLQTADTRTLQQRLEALQEHLEADGSEPLPNDPPGADDAP